MAETTASYRSANDYVMDGPDGKRYYDIIGIPLHLVELYEGLVAAYQIAARSPQTRVQALEIAKLQQTIISRMDVIAVRTAAVASSAALGQLAATRKRPSSVAGASQSGRLADGVSAKPLNIILPRGSGAVGVGDINRLEEKTRSGPRRHTPRYPYYWRAQEDGSVAALGKVIIGFFQPGNSPPIPGASGHPIFEPTRSGGLGTIRKPVQARHFLKEGGRAGRIFRYAQTKALDAYATESMNVIASVRVQPASRPSAASARRLPFG